MDPAWFIEMALAAIAGIIVGVVLSKAKIHFSEKRMQRNLVDNIKNQKKKDFVLNGKKYNLDEKIASSMMNNYEDPLEPEDNELLELPEPMPAERKGTEVKKKSKVKISDLMGGKKK